MHKLIITFSLAAAVATLALTGATAGATSTTRKSAGLLTCSGQAQVKPKDYTLFCGDANETLIKLHWKDWGHRKATATGLDAVNLCDPDCAAGKLRNFKVAVSASKLTNGDYDLLTIHFVHKVPPGDHRTEKFKVNSIGPVIE